MNRASVIYKIAVSVGYITDTEEILDEFNASGDTATFENWLAKKGIISNHQAMKLNAAYLAEIQEKEQDSHVLSIQENIDDKNSTGLSDFVEQTQPLDSKEEIFDENSKAKNEKDKMQEPSLPKTLVDKSLTNIFDGEALTKQKEKIVEDFSDDEDLEDSEIYDTRNDLIIPSEEVKKTDGTTQAHELEESEEFKQNWDNKTISSSDFKQMQFSQTIVDKKISEVIGGDVTGQDDAQLNSNDSMSEDEKRNLDALILDESVIIEEIEDSTDAFETEEEFNDSVDIVISDPYLNKTVSKDYKLSAIEKQCIESDEKSEELSILEDVEFIKEASDLHEDDSNISHLEETISMPSLKNENSQAVSSEEKKFIEDIESLMQSDKPQEPPKTKVGLQEERSQISALPFTHTSSKVPSSGSYPGIDFEKDIPPGTILAGCRVESRIGEGGMGIVYRAQHLGLDRSVAIKVLPKQLVEKASQYQRFQSEARVIAKLEHPNVVQVHHFGLKAGNPFIIMQWLKGLTLGEKISEKGKLELDEVLDIVIQAAHGLAAAHAAGVIHRDVKPDNVFINPNRNVKILDFGLAKEVEADVKLSQAGAFLGTPHYVAPEQAWSDSEITSSADTYSLGIMVFEMLTGEPPFTGSLYQILSGHASAPLPSIADLRPDVPIELEDLIIEMTEKKVEARPPSMQEVADRFELMKIGRQLAKDPQLKSKLGRRFLELSKVANEAEDRRAKRQRSETRRKVFKFVGISVSILIAIAIIVSVPLFWIGTTGDTSARELERKRFEQLIKKVKLADDADTASKIIYSIDDFLASASIEEYKNKIKKYRFDMLKLFEKERNLIESEADELLGKANEAVTEEEAGNFLISLDKFSRKYSIIAKSEKFAEKFTNAKEFLNEIISKAEQKRKIENEFETLYKRAAQITEATKAKLVIEDIKIFAERYKNYIELNKKLSSVQLKLEKIIHVAEEKAFNERRVVELLNRAVNVIDYALALFIMDEINKFLKEKPQFRSALDPGINNLQEIITSGEKHLEKQRQASKLQNEAKNISDAEMAQKILDKINHFLENAMEFKVSLEPSIQKLMRLIAAAENKEKILKEKTELLALARKVVEYREAQKVLEKIERFLLKAPEFNEELSVEKIRIENIIYIAATFIAQERQAQALLNEARNFRKIESEQEIEKAKEMLNDLENFRLKYPAQSSKLESTINWLTAIITSKTITPDEITVPKDVNQKPWQTMNFQEKGNFKLKNIVGVYRFRHAAQITDLTSSNDGNWLVSSSTDKTVKIWEASTGLEVCSLVGHIAPVLCIAVNKDFTKIASGSDDNTCKIWDPITHKILLSLTGHTDSVTAVTFDPTGDQVLTGSRDKTAILWDAARQDRIRTFNNATAAITSVAISPDGEIVIIADESSNIILYDTFSGKKIKTYTQHSSAITSMTITSSGNVISASEEGIIKIWSAETGETIKTLTAHELPILSVSISNDNKYLISSSADLTSIIWNMETFEKYKTLKGHRHYVSGGVFAANGDFVYTSSWDTSIKRWYFPSCEEKNIQGTPHLGPVVAAAMTADGKFCTTSSLDGVVAFWDNDLNEIWSRNTPDGNAVTTVSIIGKYIAAGTRENLFFFEMQSGNIVHKENNNGNETSEKDTPDSNDTANKSADKPMSKYNFEVYTDNFAVPETWNAGITSLVRSSNGKFLIAGLLNGKIKIWNRENGDFAHLSFKNVRDRQLLPIIEVACTPDGKVISAVTAKRAYFWKISDSGGDYEFFRSINSSGKEIFKSVKLNRTGIEAIIAGGTLKLGFITIINLVNDSKPIRIQVYDALTNKIAYLGENNFITMSRNQELKIWNRDDLSEFVFNIDCRDASEISDAFTLSENNESLVVVGHRGTILLFEIKPKSTNE